MAVWEYSSGFMYESFRDSIWKTLLHAGADPMLHISGDHDYHEMSSFETIIRMKSMVCEP